MVLMKSHHHPSQHVHYFLCRQRDQHPILHSTTVQGVSTTIGAARVTCPQGTALLQGHLQIQTVLSDQVTKLAQMITVCPDFLHPLLQMSSRVTSLQLLDICRSVYLLLLLLFLFLICTFSLLFFFSVNISFFFKYILSDCFFFPVSIAFFKYF